MTASTAPAPELAPVARAARGEVVVTLFHETHIHGRLLGRELHSGTPPTDEPSPTTWGC
jgi:hypothetical protein